jgi:zinc protease
MRRSPLLLVFFSIGATAATAAPSKQLATIETVELANGLRVAFARVDSAPVVSVQLWYHVGAKDEPSGKKGVARLVEHSMFKGSEHVRADSHAQMLAARGGYVHATVDEDSTHYIDTVPAEYMDFAMELEADRMRRMLVRKPAIDNERELVKDEMRQVNASPFLRLHAAVFTKHPYASGAGGNPADVDKVTAEDVKAFYDAYYQPNDALLVVVGKTSFDRVKAAAEKYFGSIAKGAQPPRPSADARDPEQTAKRREVVDPAGVGIVMIGWHIPAAREKDIYALQVASMVLGVGEGSRIKARLKAPDGKKPPVALDGGVQGVVVEDPGVMIAVGVFREPTGGDAVEAAMLDEINKVATKGIDAAELRRAKEQIESGFTFSVDRAQGLAEAVGRSWILTGDPSRGVRDLDEIDKVSAADVQRVVKQYLSADRATTLVVPPIMPTKPNPNKPAKKEP